MVGLYEATPQIDPPEQGQWTKFVKGKMGFKPEDKKGSVCKFIREGHPESIIMNKKALTLYEIECPRNSAYTSMMTGGKCLANKCENGYT
jgi:hypothetical protein